MFAIALTMFQVTHLDSKSRRTAARSAMSPGSPALASWSLRGTLTALVTTNTTPYRTSAAMIHGRTPRPDRRCSTRARMVNSSPPRKQSMNQPLTMATLIFCIASTKVRLCERPRPGITA